MEVELLRIITGEQRMPAARDSLFVLHFSLYHALYNLKYHAGACGFYLHLDPMRIRLIKTPGAGRCHHYFPETGIHCGHPSDGGSYCNRHHDPYSLTALSYDPLHDFYCNPENISFGTSDILGKLMNGVIIYALRRGEIEQAKIFFGLSRLSMKTVKIKYHELAKLYHPDRNRGDDSLMKELNHSYQVLMEVFVY